MSPITIAYVLYIKLPFSFQSGVTILRSEQMVGWERFFVMQVMEISASHGISVYTWVYALPNHTQWFDWDKETMSWWFSNLVDDFLQKIMATCRCWPPSQEFLRMNEIFSQLAPNLKTTCNQGLGFFLFKLYQLLLSLSCSVEHLLVYSSVASLRSQFLIKCLSQYRNLDHWGFGSLPSTGSTLLDNKLSSTRYCLNSQIHKMIYLGA